MKNIDKFISENNFTAEQIAAVKLYAAQKSPRKNNEVKQHDRHTDGRSFWYYRTASVLIVLTVKPNNTDKLAPKGEHILNSYFFDLQQLQAVKNGLKSIFDIYNFDGENCLGCPFSKSGGYKLGKCYVHKMHQTLYNVRLLKQAPDNIPTLPDVPPAELLEAVRGKFARFGTYGEPIHLSVPFIATIAAAARSYTGYSHQWHKPENSVYAGYFMASVHSIFEERLAAGLGWRSFIIVKKDDPAPAAVVCPTQNKESVTNCAKCALCSGTNGKGIKSVQISYH